MIVDPSGNGQEMLLNYYVRNKSDSSELLNMNPFIEINDVDSNKHEASDVPEQILLQWFINILTMTIPELSRDNIIRFYYILQNNTINKQQLFDLITNTNDLNDLSLKLQKLLNIKIQNENEKEKEARRKKKTTVLVDSIPTSQTNMMSLSSFVIDLIRALYYDPIIKMKPKKTKAIELEFEENEVIEPKFVSARERKRILAMKNGNVGGNMLPKTIQYEPNEAAVKLQSSWRSK